MKLDEIFEILIRGEPEEESLMQRVWRRILSCLRKAEPEGGRDGP